MEQKTYRPGVYSRYDLRSQYSGSRQGWAFLCAGAKTREGVSLPAGGVVKLERLAQLEGYFTPEDSGFYAMAKILLESGVEGVYGVPVTIDGSKPEDAALYEALPKLGEIRRPGVLCCAAGGVEAAGKLAQTVQESSSHEREKIAVGWCEDPVTAQEAAGSCNSERLVLVCQAGSGKAGEAGSPMLSAAAVAGMLAAAEADESFCGRELVLPGGVEAVEEETLETLLGAGVTVLEMQDDVPVCVRAVTTRTKTGEEEDRTFLPVNTVLMIDAVMQAVRQRLQGLISQKAGMDEDAVAAQTAVALEEQRRKGLLVEFAPPVAFRDSEDPSVCQVEMELTLAAVWSQIYLTAQVQL